MKIFTARQLDVDVVEPGSRRRKGTVACRLNQHISFDLEALESFSSMKWQPIAFDLLVIAAAVEFCDRSLARSSMNWGRKFSVLIPVHDPCKWSSRAVSQSLVDALNLLTGDDWNFEFKARKVPAIQPAQDRMRFPPQVEAVLAFSDGLDSCAVAGLEKNRLGSRLLRVRVGSKQHDVSRHDRKEIPFKAIPYSVKLDGGRNPENSARSRGFKFGVVSALAAYLVDAPVSIVPESGQGALAPVFLPVGQAYEDYRNYPAFTTKMERFFRTLLGFEIKYQFPRLWSTKGETLREFVEIFGVDAKWSKTRSCWQQSRQAAVSGRRRQCGVCAACILRRLSVHAAGLHESQDAYVWESLQAHRWEDGAASEFSLHTTALREYAIAGVLHFNDLAAIPGSVQYELIKRRRANELAEATSMSPKMVTERLDRLLSQHAKEWVNFTDDLGPKSFVRQWIND